MTTAVISPATMVLSGVEYRMELATITSTMLGYEDHGIFTGVLNLDLSSGGSQGAGTFILDAKRYPHDNRSWERIGTAYGHDWIIQAMKVVGVETWEQLRGKKVYALYTEHYGTIRGLANVNHPATNYFIFEQHAKEFKG